MSTVRVEEVVWCWKKTFVRKVRKGERKIVMGWGPGVTFRRPGQRKFLASFAFLAFFADKEGSRDPLNKFCEPRCDPFCLPLGAVRRS